MRTLYVPESPCVVDISYRYPCGETWASEDEWRRHVWVGVRTRFKHAHERMYYNAYALRRVVLGAVMIRRCPCHARSLLHTIHTHTHCTNHLFRGMCAQRRRRRTACTAVRRNVRKIISNFTRDTGPQPAAAFVKCTAAHMPPPPRRSLREQPDSRRRVPVNGHCRPPHLFVV